MAIRRISQKLAENLALKMYQRKKEAAGDNEAEEQKKMIMNLTNLKRQSQNNDRRSDPKIDE